MKILLAASMLFSSAIYASTCDKIVELGYPVESSCEGVAENLDNTQIAIESAKICWGGFGSKEENGFHAVAVEMTTSEGEIIEYVWDMPTGRANRTNMNDYTYYGTWKKGVFFEDQTTIKEEGKFFKAISSRGAVINYRENEVELIETFKPFFGKKSTVIDAFIKCSK